MDVKQQSTLEHLYLPYLSFFFFIAALSEASEKLTISHPGAKGTYRHNGLRMNPAQDVTDITCQDTYCLFLRFKLILQNLKV